MDFMDFSDFTDFLLDMRPGINIILVPALFASVSAGGVPKAQQLSVLRTAAVSQPLAVAFCCMELGGCKKYKIC
jgi:hypothetical protein